MVRAFAGWLLIFVFICAGPSLSPAQVVINDTSAQLLNRNASGHALAGTPVKTAPGRLPSPAGRTPRFARGNGGDSLPVVEKIGLADLRRILQADSGNVVLVNAWATWCKPCREEMPNLLRTSKLYRDKPFRLILLSADDVDDLETKVRPALQKFGVDFRSYVLSDANQDGFISGMSESWSGALPATFLYSRDGKLAEMKVGERTYRQFRDAVGKLLGE